MYKIKDKNYRNHNPENKIFCKQSRASMFFTQNIEIYLEITKAIQL